MAKLTWDDAGKRIYETGVDHAVIYLADKVTGAYTEAEVWNGITAITESPSGAEATPVYADNIEYANMTSAEKFGATLEALTYPELFEQCDGSAVVSEGVTIGQQNRRRFGLSYRTLLGNDLQDTDFGYKLHLVYGAKAAPTEKARNTINESPETATFSWELSTTPIKVDGFKPTSHLTIDSTKVDAVKLADFEDLLYGDGTATATLPTPEEVIALFGAAAMMARVGGGEEFSDTEPLFPTN